MKKSFPSIILEQLKLIISSNSFLNCFFFPFDTILPYPTVKNRFLPINPKRISLIMFLLIKT